MYPLERALATFANLLHEQHSLLQTIKGFKKISDSQIVIMSVLHHDTLSLNSELIQTVV
jgi:hypothetical protein